MKRADLLFAFNETTHALRFAQAAASRFTLNPAEVEAGSKMAESVAFISNRLTDAQTSLSVAEAEIGRLVQDNSAD